MSKRILIVLAGLAALPLQAGTDDLFADRFMGVATEFNAVWSPDVELVEGDAVAALIDVDASGAVFTFSTALLTAAGVDFTPGEIMVLEGVALRRVDGVSPSGTETIVTTSQAALNEAITSGQMDWSLGIGFEEIASAEMFIPGRGTGCSPAFDPEAQQISFECSFDDYTMAMNLSRTGSTTTIQYQVTKGTDQANASITGTGTLSNFDANGSASFDGGELTGFQQNTRDAQMDLNIALAAAGSGSNDLNFEVPFPIIRIPFNVGPIPMSIDIGVQFVAIMEVPLAATASATASADFRYRGDTGFTYEGATVDTTATINDHDFLNGEFDSASNFVSVDAGFGIAFPRVSLNVLTSEVAWVHTGFTLQSSLRFGPICKVGIAGLVVQGGYQLEIMGVEIFSEQATFAQEERRVESEGCPQRGVGALSFPSI
ncbi:hypothetical protein [Wenzhouxiangella marina]|uniref:hypothetical protein n=1 Tax=Wenzhouxiangella marina TaxID=1579979 RepID=UPI0012E30303|nr:hypothetical protein [Wenzhouxiangella marina]MBB6087032.1 hypothetical protein [Wenzhouxiangella marina]